MTTLQRAILRALCYRDLWMDELRRAVGEPKPTKTQALNAAKGLIARGFVYRQAGRFMVSAAGRKAMGEMEGAC